MQRPLPEALASQPVMLRNRGTAKPRAGNAAIAAAFEKRLREVDTGMDGKLYVKTLRVSYREVLRDAETIAKTVTQFLGVSFS
jgi:hypothetical protein